MGLEDLSLFLELGQLLFQLLADHSDRFKDPLIVGYEMLGRIDHEVLLARERLAGLRLDNRQLLDFIAPEFQSQCEILIRRPDLDGVATDAEFAPLNVRLGAEVLDVDKLEQKFLSDQ